ncbi:hypothetical protein SAY87_015042 [Trapa incisa]|uniref:Uncharacterized protein n=1 Tax=Trapa incisa TaxID=236973 RepID=A0AAN7GPK6_9MYRT|nr:hypothetical protein SAY87_015042 [Trapa incisa]
MEPERKKKAQTLRVVNPRSEPFPVNYNDLENIALEDIDSRASGLVGLGYYED